MQFAFQLQARWLPGLFAACRGPFRMDLYRHELKDIHGFFGQAGPRRDGRRQGDEIVRAALVDVPPGGMEQWRRAPHGPRARRQRMRPGVEEGERLGFGLGEAIDEVVLHRPRRRR